ncbi:chitin-binding type-2 domain-containing protein [Trichonephila clavipes]|nr:chitin-binding type-2 domain-containing protein [Trichonephila clavipes]
MMQISLFLFMLVGSALAKSTSWQDKKEKYALPEGAELLVGPIRSTFQCFANGYYADTDNNCQIFHICSSTDSVDGTRTQMQYSFLCGNQTVFNQLTFTCTYAEDAVPCVHAQDFYYLNSHIESDDPEIHFLDDQDVQRAAPSLGLRLTPDEWRNQSLTTSLCEGGSILKRKSKKRMFLMFLDDVDTGHSSG